MDRTSVRFKQLGDKELWIIHGESWSIPVYATPMEREAEQIKCVGVAAAIPLSPGQYSALADRLAAAATEYSTTNGAVWVLDNLDSADGLAQYGERARGVTPEYYMQWEAEPKPMPANAITGIEVPKPAKPAELTSEMQAFIKRVWERTNLADVKLLSFLYDALCAEAQRWLLEDLKPLDLGFVRLAALPYRANWKQILLAKFPKIIRFFKMPKEKRDVSLALTDYVVEIKNSDLWAIDKKENYFHWTIEAIPTRTWHKYAEQKERNRLTSLSRSQYARAWARLIQKLEPRINDAMEHFILQTAIPCGAVLPGTHYGPAIVSPCVPKGRVVPVSRDHVETRVATPDPDAAPMVNPLSGEPKPISLQAQLLPESVPVIQFGVKDVRDAGRDMAEGPNGSTK